MSHISRLLLYDIKGNENAFNCEHFVFIYSIPYMARFDYVF